MRFVNAFNAISSNVWCVFLIVLAVGLILRGHEREGVPLLTGAFGVLQHREN